MKINVLWIDDQYKEQNNFLVLAENHRIAISPYSNVEDGIEELASKPAMYDSVILDANCYRKKDDNSIGTSALPYAFQQLEKHHLYHPVFIYSGGAGAGATESTIRDIIEANQNRLGDTKWYSKPREAESLLQKINDVVKDKERFQLKLKYADVVEQYPRQDQLLKILSVLEKGETRDPSVFTDIRKELELIMAYCIECGVLRPDKEFKNFSEPGTKLNACKKALCNNVLSSSDPKIIPVYIQRLLYYLVDITNNGSHSLRDELDADVRRNHAPYLIAATINAFLLFIIWVKGLPNENRLEEREELRRKVESLLKQSEESDNPTDEEMLGYEGKIMVVEQDDSGIYHCGECVLNMGKARNLVGFKVKLFNVEFNTSGTKKRYKYYAKIEPKG